MFGGFTVAVGELCLCIDYEPFYCYSVLTSKLVFLLPDWKDEFCYIHVTLMFDRGHPSYQEYRKER